MAAASVAGLRRMDRLIPGLRGPLLPRCSALPPSGAAAAGVALAAAAGGGPSSSSLPAEGRTTLEEWSADYRRWYEAFAAWQRSAGWRV